MTVLAGAAVAK